MLAPKYRAPVSRARPASFIRGSASRRDVAGLFKPEVPPMMTLSSRAAAAAIASLFLMSPAFAQTTAPATPRARGHARAEDGAGKEGREAAQRGVAAMLQGGRCQGPPRQGAQEIHVRLQEGRQGSAEDVGRLVIARHRSARQRAPMAELLEPGRCAHCCIALAHLSPVGGFAIRRREPDPLIDAARHAEPRQAP